MTQPGPPIMCALVLEDAPTERLVFSSFPVGEGINENYTTNWNPTKGTAPEPLFWKWAGGSWTNFTLSLEFVAGIDAEALDPRSEAQLIADMKSKVRWCQALGFPRGRTRRPPGERRTNAYPGDPPVVLVTYGRFMTLRCLCFGANVIWRGPFDHVTADPHGAKVDISLQRVSGFYPDWYDIKEGVTRLTGADLQSAQIGQVQAAGAIALPGG